MTESAPVVDPKNEGQQREAGINQCDGCRRGLPVVDGIHEEEGYPIICCTKDRYESQQQQSEPSAEEVAVIRRTCAELAAAFDSLATAYPENDVNARLYRLVAMDCRGAIRSGWLSVTETLPATDSTSASVVLAVDPSVEHPSKSVAVPAIETELKEALERLNRATNQVAHWLESEYDTETPSLFVLQEEKRAARAAIEALVSRVLEERDRLREYNIKFMGEIAVLRDDLRLAEKAADTWQIACDQNAAERDLAVANSLSKEEANAILADWDWYPVHEDAEDKHNAIVKLRAISGELNSKEQQKNLGKNS